MDTTSPDLAPVGNNGATTPTNVSSQQVASRNDGAGRNGNNGTITSRISAEQPTSHSGTRINVIGSGQIPQPLTGGTANSTPGDELNERRGRNARALSGVAVAVTGDPGLLGPVTSVLTSEMEAAGQRVVDAESLPAVEGLLRNSEPGAGRLIHRLRAEGLAVLLLARVDPAGTRELHYMGRSDTAYSAHITLTAYDLATGRPLGTPGRATIEYTAATAERESEKVVGRLARSSLEAIQNR
jgi:hypothetical protein